MNIELLSITPNAEELIERACRTCYDSTVNESTREQFIKSIIKRNHLSVIEHASASFKITEVSRALTHQLVRHRIASFSQRSQRYVKEGQFEYVLPPAIEVNIHAKDMYIRCMERLQATYDNLLKFGIKAEDARFVLPNACTTEIVVSMNFRALRHFFELRCDKHAQWEIRILAKEMLKIMLEKCPCCFEDLKGLLDE